MAVCQLLLCGCKMTKKFSEPELHAFIGRAARAGYTSTVSWHDSTQQFEGRSLCGAYVRLNQLKRKGKSFAGYDTWNNYLEQHHGLTLPNKWELSNDEVHNSISRAIQLTKGGDSSESPVSLNKWRYEKKPLLDGRSLYNLWNFAARRKVDKKGFFGYGSWEKYLEEKHEVVSLFQPSWSDERIHRTIALLVEKYPPEKMSWRKNKIVLHGRTLRQLYAMVSLGNRPISEKRNWFGRGNWANYIKWVKDNYGNSPKG